ncbi:MAG: TonB-dependent receptor [Verrucomicrobiia bacterium]
MRRLSLLILFASFSCDAQPAFTTLEPVVVTATRTKEKTITPDVTVLNSDELQAKGITTVEQALRQVSGLSIATSGGPGQLSSIFSRGTESNHTTILIDGVRTSPGLAGGYDLANLTLDNVERIEVVKGPVSTLYGQDAIGGVINIITRSGEGERMSGEASFETGSYSTFQELAASRGAFGLFDYSFSATKWVADYHRVNDDIDLFSVRAKLGFRISDTARLETLVNYYKADNESPGSIPFSTPTAELTREIFTLAPKFTWQTTPAWKQTVITSFTQEDQNYMILPVVDNQTLLQYKTVDYQSDFQISSSWKLTFGANLEWNQVDLFANHISAIDESHFNYGFYLQSQWELFKNFQMISSLRYDNYQAYDAPITWQQTFSYELPTQTLLYAKVGTAYSPPTFQDLYFPGFGNPNLEAEESFSYEIGFTQYFWQKKIRFTSAYFRNEIQNLIQFDGVLPQNISEAETWGVENSFTIQPWNFLSLSLGYTYLEANDTEAQIRLVRRPRHLFTSDLIVKPLSCVTLFLGAEWKREREDFDALTFQQKDMPDYLTLRSGLQWAINRYCSVGFRIENLWDEEYEEVSGYPAPRRAYYVKTEFRF